jgi:hypothetical protein
MLSPVTTMLSPVITIGKHFSSIYAAFQKSPSVSVKTVVPEAQKKALRARFRRGNRPFGREWKNRHGTSALQHKILRNRRNSPKRIGNEITQNARQKTAFTYEQSNANPEIPPDKTKDSVTISKPVKWIHDKSSLVRLITTLACSIRSGNDCMRA